MDRRTLLAISLCFIIFALWQKYYLEPRTLHPFQGSSQTEQVGAGNPASGSNSMMAAAPSGAGGETKAVPPAKQQPEQTLSLKSGTGDLTVSNGTHFISQWLMRGYHQAISTDTPLIGLGSVTNQDGDIGFAVDDPALAYINTVQGSLQAIPNGALWTYEDQNVKLSREMTTTVDQPWVDLRVTAEFKTKKPAYAFLSLSAQSFEKDPEAQDRQLMYLTNGSVERVHLKEAPQTKEVGTPIKYIGASSRYFLLSIINQGPLEPRGLVQPSGPAAGRMSMVYPISGNSITIPTRVFFGPKELQLLRSVDPRLDNAVDFGWFTIFAYPLLKILRWFYLFLGNYGAAIILLTVLLKLATYPLQYKSAKSMKEMARIQPQLQRLKEKHKDDREALNREMLTLMRSHGYNPMAGCFPIILQMPIFIALYRVLYNSTELYHAPFALWIHDLSARDPYYVTPVLLSLFMFVSQKLQPTTATDPAQQKMMQIMPLMFGAFMLALPSGLTLYMLVNSVVSIGLQMLLNKKLDKGHAQPVAARAR